MLMHAAVLAQAGLESGRGANKAVDRELSRARDAHKLALYEAQLAELERATDIKVNKLALRGWCLGGDCEGRRYWLFPFCGERIYVESLVWLTI